MQANGNPAFDALGKLFHYLGLPVFYIPALVYWSVNKQLGRRMLFALVLSVAVVSALKFVFKARAPIKPIPTW